MPYREIENSSFLDFASWRSGATAPTGTTPLGAGFSINVALILERASDPTPLLDSNWGSRQRQLQDLNDSGTLWTTYGANATNYNQVMSELGTYGATPVATPNGYVSSAESRTIWVTVTGDGFQSLFDTALYRMNGGGVFWEGNLSLPQGWRELGVRGLWFDGDVGPLLPNPGSGTPVVLPQGWQSPGNASTNPTNIPPQTIAAYYNFPFTGALWDPTSGIAPATGAIGLVEPKVGTAVPAGSFNDLLNAYRHQIGIATPANVTTVDPGGQAYPTNITPPAFNPAGERSLDVGVVTAINPQSELIVYAGSGTLAGANSNAFTAYQSAFWDLVNNPAVITSSFGFVSQTAPGSPFMFAARELFIDAALRGITVFNDAGDGGSGNQFANGLTNVSTSRASPFAFMVGGTAYNTIGAALADETMNGLVVKALAGDHATIWQLVAGGMTEMPNAGNQAAALIETVWNEYLVTGNEIASRSNNTGYQHNNTGSGGVDPSQRAPSYQRDFGLNPTTSDPSRLNGRGVPDVSADAGGNMHYMVPNPAMTAIQADGGTSASTPLWAALASQINVIFNDQGLPNLGYANDLVYIAAAVAPAALNDITVGSNTSSHVASGTAGAPSYFTDGGWVTATGYGYSAAPGYDLVSGLGTPNGVLLARALTAIAHTQMYGTSPAMLDADGAEWTSGIDQSLMFQTMSRSEASVTLDIGTDAFGFMSGASHGFAWTNRFAQQSVQSDFDPNLVRMFDKQAHGFVAQSVVETGEHLSVFVDGAAARAVQASLTSAFGFADFVTDAGVVRVARAVAVAETAGGADDTTAIVRVRQNGENNLELMFYKVDDFTGTIDGQRAGSVGYEAAAAARAYQLTTGGTTLNGPGYGNFEQSGLVNVDAGDMIAMKLTNLTTGAHYWAFAHANEAAGGREVGHLWSYGLNTWGWEDQHGGGDHDYNDLIVQFDFTSSAGRGWLA